MQIISNLANVLVA